MSPEQAKLNQLDVDTRSDIYALGVLLYELLTSTTPLDRMRLRSVAFDEMLRIIREEEPPTPSSRLTTSESALAVAAKRGTEPQMLTRRIRGDLDWIIMKSLAKERSDRYQSALDLGADIGRHLDDQPIIARPPSTLLQARKFARRHKWPLTLSGFLLVAILVTATSFIVAIVGEGQRRRESQINHVLRLTAQSNHLQKIRPIESVRLATEAIKFSRSRSNVQIHTAHEALLNAMPRLTGRSLKSDVSAVSMTSRWLITLHEDPGVVKLFDLHQRDPLAKSTPLKLEGDGIEAVAADETGRHLVTAGNQLRLWNLNADDLSVASFRLFEQRIDASSLKFSPNGRWLVARDTEGTVRVWDLASAERSVRIAGSLVGDIEGVAVSNDGNRFVFDIDTLVHHRELQLWDLQQDESARQPRFFPNRRFVRILDQSKDGRWLATRSDGIRVWDLESEDPTATSKVIPAPPGMSGQVAAFSPDGHRLYVCRKDQLLCWELPEEGDPVRLPQEWEAHADGAVALRISGDGKKMVSTGCMGETYCWDLASANPVATRLHLRHGIRGTTVIDPTGRWVCVAGANARLWDLERPNPDRSPLVLSNHRSGLESRTTVSSDGRWIAVATQRGLLTDSWDADIWDTHTTADASRYRQSLAGHQTAIGGVHISPDDHYFVLTSSDGTSRIWDLRSRSMESVSPSSLFESKPRIVRFPLSNQHVPDGRKAKGSSTVFCSAVSHETLAVSSPTGEIVLWSLNATNSELPQRVLRAHRSAVFRLAFSPDGRWLVSASSAGVLLHDLVAELDTSPSCWLDDAEDSLLFAFRGDCQQLAVASQERVMLYDLSADNIKRPMRTLFPDKHRNNDFIWQMSMSHDGRWLFTSRHDATAQLWDLGQPSLAPRELTGHGGVQAAAISADSHWLVTSNRLGHAQLWDLHSADPNATPRTLVAHEGPIWKVEISADSQWLVTFSSDGTTRRWRLDLAQLLNDARNGD